MSRRAVAVWDILAFPWAPLSVGSQSPSNTGPLEPPWRARPSSHCLHLTATPFSFGFVSPHPNQGYIKMFEIPAGARHLLIQEADTTSHHLGECQSQTAQWLHSLTLLGVGGLTGRHGLQPYLLCPWLGPANGWISPLVLSQWRSLPSQQLEGHVSKTWHTSHSKSKGKRLAHWKSASSTSSGCRGQLVDGLPWCVCIFSFSFILNSSGSFGIEMPGISWKFGCSDNSGCPFSHGSLCGTVLLQAAWNPSQGFTHPHAPKLQDQSRK